MQALEDPVESVRQAAVVAIGEIEPGSRLLQPVVGLLRSSDATIRRAAVRAFATSRLKPIGFLRLSQQDMTPMRRFDRHCGGVGEWGGSPVSLAQRTLAHDLSPGVRAEAAYRLGMLSDSDTRAALNTASREQTGSAGAPRKLMVARRERSRCIDEFDKLFAGLFIDVGKLELPIPGNIRKMAVQVVVLRSRRPSLACIFPRRSGIAKIDGKLGPRSQRAAAFENNPPAPMRRLSCRTVCPGVVYANFHGERGSRM